MADLTQTIRAKEQDVTKLKIQAAQDKLKKLQSNQPVEEEDAETKHGIFVVNSLGYDQDDNEHFEVNINGKVIVILEEPDRTLHAQGGSVAKSLFEHHYDEIKNVIQSYLQSRGASKTTSGEDAETKHNWKTCSCEKCKRARYIADHVEDKKEWPSDMRKESTNIANFLKSENAQRFSFESFVSTVVSAISVDIGIAVV